MDVFGADDGIRAEDCARAVSAGARAGHQ